MIPHLSVTDRYRILDLNPMPSQVCEPNKVMRLSGRKIIGYSTIDKIASVPRNATGVMLPAAACAQLMAGGK
jgi:hypothetical protein